MQHHLKRAGALAAVVAGCALASAGPADAASIAYYEGTTTSQFGPWHSLIETSVRSLGGALSCTAAADASHAIVGTAYCIDGVDNVVAHPYNATLRYGWCGVPAGSGAAYMRCREDY
ncbi:hypothetical protein AB0L40_00090 [Patulibacter sp. NPDC049589]|uniref:hypothetical protein n=1 Tax=Patulibacter sp. NPDC049589 TaxID=3154731 RepID=UPI00344178E2